MDDSSSSRPQRAIAALMFFGFLAGVGLMQLPRPPAPPAVVTATTERPVYGHVDTAPAPTPTQQFQATESLALPAILVEVHNPSTLKEAWDGNAWAKELRASALGRGFFGGWAPLFGSRGEDLRTSLKGALADVLLTRVLTNPFQLIWFQGESAQGMPALRMPQASSTALAALDALGSVDGAELDVPECPPVPEEPKDDPDGGAPPRRKTALSITTPAGPFKLRAYTIAESTFVAGRSGETLILGGTPGAVITALCAPIPAMQPRSGVDVDLTIIADNLGRESELLTSLIGITGPLHLGFGVEKDGLSPRGIAAQLGAQVRLADAAMSADMLKLVPEDTGIALVMNLKLPAKLDGESLSKALKDGPAADAQVRQVAFIFNPSGAASGPPEAALLWGNMQDQEALGAVLNGSLSTGTACNHVVMSTSVKLRKHLQDACEGNTPSLQHAADSVVTGLKSPHALGLHVQPGRILWNLTLDGYQRAGRNASAGLSDEMVSAQRLFEALPFLGFKGRVTNGALTGEGFRS